MGFLVKDKTDAEWWALTVLWCVALALYVVFGAWYYACRAHDSIAARSPMALLTILSLVWLNLLSGIVVTELWAPTVQCDTAWGWTLYPVNEFALLALFAAAAWRCLQLIAKAEQQRIHLTLKLADEGFGDAAGGDGETAGAATAATAAASPTAGTPLTANPLSDSDGLAAMPVARDSWLERSDNWFQRHIRWLTSWWVALALTVYCLLWPAYRFADPVTDSDPEGRCLLFDQVVQFWAAALGVLMFVLAWKVRTIRDAFDIVWELKAQGIAALLHVAFIVVYPAVYRAGVGSALWHVETIALMAVLLVITFVWPLWRVYHPPTRAPTAKRVGSGSGKARLYRGASAVGLGGQPQPPHLNPAAGASAPAAATGPLTPTSNTFFPSDAAGSESDGEGGIPAEFATLERLLASKPGRRAFTSHLMMEFALENLMFHDEVARMKAVPADAPLADVRTAALDIYQRFVAPGAPLEINIASDVKAALRREFRPLALLLVPGARKPSDPAATHATRGRSPRTLAVPMTAMAPTAVATAGGGGGGASAPRTPDRPPSGASTAIASRPASAALGDSKVADGSGGKSGTTSAAVSIVVVGGDRPAAFYRAVFDAAAAEIVHLLATDSYRRFVASALFEQLLERVALAKQLGREHQRHVVAARPAPSRSPAVPHAPLPAANARF